MKFVIFWRQKTGFKKHRALYLIVQCIFGWDWSITKLLTSEFFIKWTQFFIKSIKIGVFYQYGYTDITINRDPCKVDT